MTKPTKWHLRPAKTQISLGIRPVWSESSLSAWRKLGSLATHWALIWVFAGRTCHFVGFVMRRLILFGTYSNFDQIGSFTLELLAIECRKPTYSSLSGAQPDWFLSSLNETYSQRVHVQPQAYNLRWVRIPASSDISLRSIVYCHWMLNRFSIDS